MNLSSKCVEVVGGSRTVYDGKVVGSELLLEGHTLIFIAFVIAQLQKSLDPALTMLRSLSVHTMWQGKD